LKVSADISIDKASIIDLQIFFNVICYTGLFLGIFLLVTPKVLFLSDIGINQNITFIFLAVIFYVFAGTLSVVFQGRYFLKTAVIILQILPNSIIMIFIFIEGYISLRFEYIYILAYLTSALVGVVLLISFSILDFNNRSWLLDFKFDTPRELMNIQGVYWLNSISTLAVTAMPIVFVGIFFNDDFTSQFSFALRMSQGMLVILVLVNFIFSPTVRRLITKGLLSKALLYFNKMQMISSVSAFIAFILLNSILFIFSKFGHYEIDQIRNMVLFFSFGLAINISFGPIGPLFIMLDRQKDNTVAGLLVFLLSSPGVLILSYFKLHFLLVTFIAFSYAVGKIYLWFKL